MLSKIPELALKLINLIEGFFAYAKRQKEVKEQEEKLREIETILDIKDGHEKADKLSKFFSRK